ncbi:MAG: sulfatase-like hydrolase/transferase [Pseudomonadales bacterium]
MFFSQLIAFLFVSISVAQVAAAAQKPEGAAEKELRPNIILVMSDDQGWGDVAYNGNPVVKTPHLDAMAAEGVRLDRFYAASPVCSPTRGSVLTGRHPFRYGIEWAGQGHLPDGEITIAEVLKAAGYRTGHFCKWHVGELSKTVNQRYFEGDLASPEHYSPPWENGFDESFSTESMMPTYNPYFHVGGDYATDDYRFLQKEAVAKGQRSNGFRWRDHFWTGPGQMVDEWLEGDISEIVMDRALNFVVRSSKGKQPFLAVIWFHTPHTPVVAGNEDRKTYAEQDMQGQHWYGALTAMDRQVGRLRDELRLLGVAKNTLLWFNSDNGPSYIHNYNSTGPFSGKKAELKEGGVRVPGIVEWPAKLSGGRSVTTPMSTSDIYRTLLAAADISQPAAQPELDGIDVLPYLSGEESLRPESIAFQSPMRGVEYDADGKRLQYALSDNRFKLLSSNAGKTWELYDLLADPAESIDLAERHPAVLASMREQLMSWVRNTEEDAQYQ